ncbi:MAG TPA: acylphosphatase [Bacteroidales bacterium]
MKHINITVFGLVQGVGFRSATKHEARYLGIKGFVRNRMDGAVYIEAEGDTTALAEFVKWCRKGPSFAEVDDVKVEEGEMKNFSTFETSY